MSTSNEYWDGDRVKSRRDSNHPIVSHYAKKKMTLFNSILDDNKKLLEIGAGDGYFSNQFEKKVNLTILDSSEAMLGANPVEADRLIMDCTKLEIEDNSFDIVFEANVLHHLDNPDLAIEEMKRVSRDYIVFIEPNRNNPLNFLLGLVIKEERQSLLYSKSFLKNKLRDHNLEIISACTHGVYPPNKCPPWYFKLFKNLDRVIPIFGYEIVVVCKKRRT